MKSENLERDVETEEPADAPASFLSLERRERLAAQLQGLVPNPYTGRTSGDEEAALIVQDMVFSLAAGIGRAPADILADILKDGGRALASALDIRDSLNPQDAAEDMLVSQMIATHKNAMRLMFYANQEITRPDLMAIMMRQASKLLGLYTKQLEALGRRQEKQRQALPRRYKAEPAAPAARRAQGAQPRPEPSTGEAPASEVVRPTFGK